MSDELRQPVEPEASPVSRVKLESGSRWIPKTPRLRKRPVAVVLFLMTCVSTFYAGSMQFLVPKIRIDPNTGQHMAQIQVDPITGHGILQTDWRQSLLNGLTYATAVMVILGAHEMGHFLQAHRYGVAQSLPMFIPMPFSPVGTMGAVIFQQAGVANRKSLFDIAISGPLAGLAVAIPLIWWGIQHSQVIQLPPNVVGWTNPLIFEWMIGWIKEPLRPGQDIALNPILFAGWVGIFITGLNLIPIGQLDGGHILYCLMGKKAHLIARGLYVGAIGYVVFQVTQGHTEYMGWTLMLILVAFIGTQHPPTANDHVPLGKTRILLGWLTLAFIFASFVPSPLYQSKGTELERLVDQEALADRAKCLRGHL